MNQEEMANDSHYGYGPNKWPVIWGVVAIVFGFVGMLAQTFKALQSWMMMSMPDEFFGDMTAAMPPPTGDPAQDKIMEDMVKSQQEMMNSITEFAPMTMASAIVMAVIAVLLAVGGILLCMRKRVASPVLQIWAGLKIVGTFFAVWVGYTMSAAMMSSYGDMVNEMTSGAGGPASPSLNFGTMFSGFAMISSVFSLLWGIWLPIYFFILFNRDTIKKDMAHGPGWVMDNG